MYSIAVYASTVPLPVSHSVLECIFVIEHVTWENCRDRFVLERTGICVNRYDLWYIATYDETTAAVCQHLCTAAADDLCTGIFYDHRYRSCRLLRSDVLDYQFITNDDGGGNVTSDPECYRMLFYRRLRCVGK